MRRFLVLFLSFCAVFPNAEAKLKFVTHLSSAGLLYFIQPSKIPVNGNGTASKAMSVDFSYLATGDSVIVSATVITKNAVNIPFVEITSGTRQIRLDAELLYIEPHRGKYKNRLQMSIPYGEFRDLYQGAHPFCICLGNNMAFSYKEKEWQTVKGEMLQIISIMDISTNPGTAAKHPSEKGDDMK